MKDLLAVALTVAMPCGIIWGVFWMVANERRVERWWNDKPDKKWKPGAGPPVPGAQRYDLG